MRLWSLHPSYLDTKGLLAVWREGLLALHVLRGDTKGYRNHPQLLRFKNHSAPLEAITAYLHDIVDEAQKRNFSFDRTKLSEREVVKQISLTVGQLQYEVEHLQKKLEKRDQKMFLKFKEVREHKTHPLFKIVPGAIEPWEKV